MAKYVEWDIDNPKHRRRHRRPPPPIGGEALTPEPAPRIRVEVLHQLPPTAQCATAARDCAAGVHRGADAYFALRANGQHRSDFGVPDDASNHCYRARRHHCGADDRRDSGVRRWPAVLILDIA
jgi:hypothetical protein